MSFPTTNTQPVAPVKRPINKQGLGKATNQALQVLLNAHNDAWLEEKLLANDAEVLSKYRKLAKIFYSQDSVIEAEIEEII